MRTLYRGLSMDVSDQVSVHLAKLFKSRSLKCEKLTDDGPQGQEVGKMCKCGVLFFPLSIPIYDRKIFNWICPSGPASQKYHNFEVNVIQEKLSRFVYILIIINCIGTFLFFPPIFFTDL